MITRMEEDDLVRVTMTLRRVDVQLLDRLAAAEGANRSAELRGILEQFRPMLEATVLAFEAAIKTKLTFENEVARASIEDLERAMPEVEKIQRTYLGALARLEGAAAAAAAEARHQDPRPSNHGGQNPHPPHEPGASENGSDQ